MHDELTRRDATDGNAPVTAPGTEVPAASGTGGGAPAPRRRLARRTWVALGIIVVLLAVLIACGGAMQTAGIRFDLLGVAVEWRLYYLVALLIIVGTMIPFFMVFERRGPQARELVVLATISAIAVAGRAAFFFLPQFKPVCAIVIIAGVCFGAESGFLVGAVTGFVSNFFFGQGAYTPWQMFCFGIVGFVAGILFRKGLLKRSRVALSVYGGLATLVLYGGIINLGTLLIAGIPFTPPAIVACYAAALPFDLVHAAATVFFMLVIGRPMLEKIDRLKVKYGLMDA